MARRRVVQLRKGLARLGIELPSAQGSAPPPRPEPSASQAGPHLAPPSPVAELPLAEPPPAVAEPPPAVAEPPPEAAPPPEPVEEPPPAPSPWTVEDEHAAAAPTASADGGDASPAPSRWLPAELIREGDEPREHPPASDPSRWLSRPPQRDV